MQFVLPVSDRSSQFIRPGLPDQVYEIRLTRLGLQDQVYKITCCNQPLEPIVETQIFEYAGMQGLALYPTFFRNPILRNLS
jgi:hypothetical protein